MKMLSRREVLGNLAGIAALPLVPELAHALAGMRAAADPRTLATRGIKTLRDDLANMPFLAHPRIDPDGTIWNLGLAGSQGVVWRLGTKGDVQAVVPITLPRASYVHDFTATDQHLAGGCPRYHYIGILCAC